MNERCRIAVADDEPDIRDYFRKVLPRLGYQLVVVAESGGELVESCRSTTPDLVIADILMPGLDGIEATKEIYRDRPVPIILVSARSDAETMSRADSGHVMGYLVKPIRQADLDPAISIALRHFGHFEELRQEIDSLREALAECKRIK